MRFASLLALLVAAASFWQPGEVLAQKPARFAQVDPKIFGFDIPNGRIRPGEGRTVLAREADGVAVVAKIYVEVGEYLILMLPDGRLITRQTAEVQGTTRPFVPASKDSLVASLVTDAYPGFRIKQTKHYLYVYNTSEGFAAVTARILESMHPGIVAYAESQGISTSRPEVPLIVVMFHDAAEFHKRTKAPEGVVAYYHILSNRVFMHEKTGLEDVSQILAAKDAVNTIAHEGTHQILANIGVQERLSFWPPWVTEGLAEFFAPTTFDRTFKWKGAAQTNDFRMLELHAYLSKKGFVADGKSVKTVVEAARLTSTGYAAAWSLVHFLSQNQRQAFNGYVKELSKLGPLEGNIEESGEILIPTNRTLFEKKFGDDFVEIEKKLLIHLNNLTKP